MWTNLVEAYKGLSEPVRRFVETLRGVHYFTPPEGQTATADFVERNKRRPLVSEHPLVRVIPENGGTRAVRQPLISQTHHGCDTERKPTPAGAAVGACDPAGIYRPFRWQPGSIAFWDNRTTSHLAPRDIYSLDFDRQLYRITLRGDVPMGVDGRISTAIEGEPFEAYSEHNPR